MSEKKQSSLPIVAPVHLAGANAIAKALGVGRLKVMAMIEDGLPVSKDPETGRYDGEYNKIQSWREMYYPAKKEEK